MARISDVGTFVEPQLSIGGGAPDRLTIASWDLRDAESAGVVAQPKAVKRVWRHTFGSERRANAAKANGAGDIDADVVLLQGVRSAKIARKLFPARDWRLILSRQLLDLTGFDNRLGQPLPDGKSITAIAVRYSRYIRVTGHEHFMPMASPLHASVLPQPVLADAGLTISERLADQGDALSDSPVLRTIAQRDEAGTATEPGTETGAESGAAGLAVRIMHSDDVIWVVSADFGDDCSPQDNGCESRAVLDTWTSKQRAGGLMVVRGEKSRTGDVPEGSATAPQAPLQQTEAALQKTAAREPAKPSGFFAWLQGGADRGPDRLSDRAPDREPANTKAAPESAGGRDDAPAGPAAAVARDCSGQSLIPDPLLVGEIKVIAEKGCLAILSMAR